MEVSSSDSNVDVENIEEATLPTPEKERPSSTKEITSNTSPRQKFLRLPLARVKAMMKMEPNCTVISHDSIFLVAKATEMFIEYVAQEAIKPVVNGNRKTLMKKDIETVIGSIPQLCFLEGTLD